MSEAGNSIGEPQGDDILAAEYVLGVLDRDARAEFERRMVNEPELERLVIDWQSKLSSFDEEFDEVAPPARVKREIDRQLFGGGAGSGQKSRGWLQSLAFWRMTTAAAIAGLILALAAPQIWPPARTSPLIATLEAQGSDVRFLAHFQEGSDRVGLRAIAGSADDGKDFELWVIAGGAKPLSLGVIPKQGTIALRPPAALARVISDGATLAITIEPVGGSPTGDPTGPVVAAGKLEPI